MTAPAKGEHLSEDASSLDAWASDSTDASNQALCHKRLTHSLPARQSQVQAQQVPPSLT